VSSGYKFNTFLLATIYPASVNNVNPEKDVLSLVLGVDISPIPCPCISSISIPHPPRFHLWYRSPHTYNCRSQLTSPIVQDDDYILNLPYARYLGFLDEDTDIVIFKNIRYAASPENQNRWKKPQPPQHIDDLQDGYEGGTCYQAFPGWMGHVVPSLHHSPYFSLVLLWHWLTLGTEAQCTALREGVDGRIDFPCRGSRWRSMRRRIVCSLMFTSLGRRSTPPPTPSPSFSGFMVAVMVFCLIPVSLLTHSFWIKGCLFRDTPDNCLE